MFSIIMPVYNCEEFIEKSLLSVINQSYTSWELILVNDGSTDKSSDICNKYSIEDNRIKVIHIQNNGPANARNIGIMEAKKEYLIFVDSDDILEKDALSTLEQEIRKKAYQIILYPNYNKLIEGNKIIISDNSLYRKEYLNNRAFKNNFINLINNNYIFPVWNKCYKRSFIIENDAKFPIGVSAAEDFVFNMSLYPNLSQGLIIEKPLYYYVNRKSGSICTSFNPKRIDSVKEVYVKCMPIIKSWVPEYLNQFNNFFITDISVCINNLFSNDANISFFEKKKIVKKIVNDKTINNSLNSTKLIGYRNIIIGKLILLKQVNILLFISKTIRFIRK